MTQIMRQTQAPIRTDSRRATHVGERTYAYRKHTRTYTHAYTHAYIGGTRPHMPTHGHKSKHRPTGLKTWTVTPDNGKNADAFMHAHTQMHTHTNVHTHKRANRQARTHTYMQIDAEVHTDMGTREYKHKCRQDANVDRHIRTRAHACTHMYVSTRTHS